jgi:hypothetical protein
LTLLAPESGRRGLSLILAPKSEGMEVEKGRSLLLSSKSRCTRLGKGSSLLFRSRHGGLETLEPTERDTEQMLDVYENPLYPQAMAMGNYSIAIANTDLKPMEAGARYVC